MKVISLQSGSNGNCVFVEASGVRLLFDAGITGRQAEQRLAARGYDIRNTDCLLISHEHADHTRCMGVYHRKFGMPVHVTRETLEMAQTQRPVGTLKDVRHFVAGSTIRIGDVTVETVSTPHDGVDGVVFVVDDGRRRIGVLTDLGHVFDELSDLVGSLDAVILESNYDPEMLHGGAYPESLKQRIRGPGGHLSNVEAAELLKTAATSRLQWACLAHLSEDNNDPSLALRTHRRIVRRRLHLHVASRSQATRVLKVS